MIQLVALAEELDALILHTIPHCSSIKKYGGTVYTVKPEAKEGQFVGLFVQAKTVQLSFSRGATLKDPQGLLQGSGKLRRHINLTTVDDVDRTQLTHLIQEAASQS